LKNKERTKEIFSGTIWEAELVKSLLSNYKIESFLKHNVITSYALEPIQADNVKVIILEKDVSVAKMVVEEFYKNQNK
jgi:hypothetical protein